MKKFNKNVSQKLVSCVFVALVLCSIFASAVSAENVSADLSDNPILNSDTSNSSVHYSLGAEINGFLSANKPVFVFFYADWCHFCQQQEPIIDELEQEYADEIAFIRVDAEDDSQALEEFGVSGYPTMVLIVGKEGDGYRYRKFGGYKGKDVLAEELEGVLEASNISDVHFMPFDERGGSGLNYPSCGNLSDFNLSISLINLTSEEFFKEISNDSESLELYNRAKDMGYTRVRQSGKIVLNNKTEVLAGLFFSEEGCEIKLVRIYSPELESSYLIKSDNANVTIIDSNGNIKVVNTDDFLDFLVPSNRSKKSNDTYKLS